MKVRIIISVVILVSVLTAGTLIVNKVRIFCSDLIELTDEASETLSVQALDSIKERWDKKTNLLSALIPHEHIDAVTLSIYRARAFLLSQNEDEYKAEIAEVIRQLKIVKQYDFPTVRSIF